MNDEFTGGYFVDDEPDAESLFFALVQVRRPVTDPLDAESLFYVLVQVPRPVSGVLDVESFSLVQVLLPGPEELGGEKLFPVVVVLVLVSAPVPSLAER